MKRKNTRSGGKCIHDEGFWRRAGEGTATHMDNLVCLRGESCSCLVHRELCREIKSNLE